MKVGDLVRHGWKGKPIKRLGILIAEGPAQVRGITWRVLWTSHTPGRYGMAWEEDLKVISASR